MLEAIEKSNIPILVQAHDWAKLPESFHREIERDHVVLQEGAKKRSTGMTADRVARETFEDIPYIDFQRRIRCVISVVMKTEFRPGILGVPQVRLCAGRNSISRHF